jgi:hypothetical protein
MRRVAEPELLAEMSALDPDSVKWLYEAIAALGIAMVVAWVLFRMFFDGWRDYLLCCCRWNANGYDRGRGFLYNALWGFAGVIGFYLINRIFG